MGNSKESITEVQLADIEYLKQRQLIKPLTEKQEEKLARLLKRRDDTIAGTLNKGCLSYLLYIYQRRRYGNVYKLKTEVPAALQLRNGTVSEPNSVQLLSEYYQRPFYRDTRKVTNDFLRGQTDVINTPLIEDATEIVDVKSILSVSDFLKMVGAPVRKSDYYEMQGYLGITGIEDGMICYCLPDIPADIVQQQWDIMFREMCPDGIVTNNFETNWALAESSMRRDGISISERVISHRIKRDEKIISNIYEKVDICRAWLNEFHGQHEQIIANGRQNYT